MDSAGQVVELPHSNPLTLKRCFDATNDPSITPSRFSTTSPTPVEVAQGISSLSTASPSTEDSPMHNGSLSRQASPAPSATSTNLTSISATPPPPSFGIDGTTQQTQPIEQPPAKRRKLTFAEKEDRRVQKEKSDHEKAEEKARKDAERAVLKARKDEEKQVRDEERRKKNEVLEEKRREKELEQLKKDEAKRKLEDEKAKKERSQSRISGFFAKPQTPIKPELRPSVSASSQSPSIHAITDEASDRLGGEASKNDYAKTFLPYALPSSTTLAPANVHTWDDAAKEHMVRLLKQEWSANSLLETLPRSHLQEALGLSTITTRSQRQSLPTVKQLITRMAGFQGSPIDLTAGEKNDPMTMIQKMPMRYLVFREDIRPPYVGTYTKQHGGNMARNPFAKQRKDTDYDYDSEAEWEEPEEGEDLDSDGESDGESVEYADDMEGFVDDDDLEGQPIRRKLPALQTDMEPRSTGLCWQHAVGDSLGKAEQQVDLQEFRLKLLLDIVKLPIDPFSTAYWPPQESGRVEAPPQSLGATVLPSSFRTPLQAIPNVVVNGTVNMLPSTSVKSTKSMANAAPLRLLSGQELEDFKKEVSGSEHNKAVLLGLLKKKFSKTTKAILTDTLSAVAVRVGRHESEKKWTLL